MAQSHSLEKPPYHCHWHWHCHHRVIISEWTLRVRVFQLISAGSTLDFILANFWQSVKKVPKLVPCAMNK